MKSSRPRSALNDRASAAILLNVMDERSEIVNRVRRSTRPGTQIPAPSCRCRPLANNLSIVGRRPVGNEP